MKSGYSAYYISASSYQYGSVLCALRQGSGSGIGGVQLVLQGLQSSLVLWLTAKAAYQFNRRAQPREGLHLEDLAALQRGDAFIGIFVEQRVDDVARHGAIGREHIALFHAGDA